MATYWLSPSFIIHTLYGPSYTPAISLLGPLGIAMGLFALIMMYTAYLLALKDMRFVKVLIVCSFLQIALLSLFHHTLPQVVYVSIITGAVTLFLLFLSRLKAK